MTYRMDSRTAPTAPVESGREEISGRTPEDAATTDLAVRNAMTTIRELMREDRKRRVRDGLPELVPPLENLENASAGSARPSRQRRRGARLAGWMDARGAWARLLAWRPTLVHVAWALAFAAVLLWPGAVLITMLVGFVICLVAVALFGSDLPEHLRERIARRLARRDRVRGAQEDVIDDGTVARPDPFDRLHDLRG